MSIHCKLTLQKRFQPIVNLGTFRNEMVPDLWEDRSLFFIILSHTLAVLVQSLLGHVFSRAVIGLTFFFLHTYLLFPIYIWPFIFLSYLDFLPWFYIVVLGFFSGWFTFHILFGLLYSSSILTFISLFVWKLEFLSLFGGEFSFSILFLYSIAVTFWISLDF